MERALGFALLGLGFLMLFGGIALLVVGEVTFRSGKSIPARVGRKAGGALVSFFPIMIVVHVVFRAVDPENPVPTNALYWPLALTCLGLAAVWILRGMIGGRAPRGFAPAPVSNTVGFDDEPTEVLGYPTSVRAGGPASAPPTRSPDEDPRTETIPTRPTVGKPPRTKPAAKNPFDFS